MVTTASLDNLSGPRLQYAVLTCTAMTLQIPVMELLINTHTMQSNDHYTMMKVKFLRSHVGLSCCKKE